MPKISQMYYWNWYLLVLIFTNSKKYRGPNSFPIFPSQAEVGGRVGTGTHLHGRLRRGARLAGRGPGGA